MARNERSPLLPIDINSDRTLAARPASLPAQSSSFFSCFLRVHESGGHFRPVACEFVVTMVFVFLTAAAAVSNGKLDPGEKMRMREKKRKKKRREGGASEKGV